MFKQLQLTVFFLFKISQNISHLFIFHFSETFPRLDDQNAEIGPKTLLEIGNIRINENFFSVFRLFGPFFCQNSDKISNFSAKFSFSALFKTRKAEKRKKAKKFKKILKLIQQAKNNKFLYHSIALSVINSILKSAQIYKHSAKKSNGLKRNFRIFRILFYL